MGAYLNAIMLDPTPFEQPGKKKSSADRSAVSGEIESGKTGGKAGFEIGADRIGVGPEEAEERAAHKKELAQTETDLERISIEIRRLEAAARARPTSAEQSEMDKKVAKARELAEKTFDGDQDMVARYVEATKKTFLEGREGISDKLVRLRQRAVDLAEQKRLLEEKLGGAESSS